MVNLYQRKFLQAGICFLAANMYGQVGINTDTPKSTLEVVGKPGNVSVADGIIAPRITGNQLFLKNNVYGADKEGTLIYVTSPATGTSLSGDTADVTEKGYYSHNGTKWIKVGTGKAWELTGNDVTPEDFFGTTNNQPIRFKVNNLRAGEIGGGKNYIGEGSGADKGTGNTAFGANILAANTALGSGNNALGNSALSKNTTGSDNTAVGYNALSDNITGSRNVAIGNGSGVTTGNLDNTVAIGINAKASGNNSVAIGYLAKAEAENSIVLGDANKEIKVGIGTTKPETALEIAGTGGINDDITVKSNNMNALESGALQFNRYRRNPNGSQINIHAGDVLGEIGFGGYFAGETQKSATISAVAKTSFVGSPLNADLLFSTKAENRMTIKSDGNIGIGTTTPTAKLEITSGVAGNSGLKLTNINSTTAATAGAAALGVDANGNVVVKDDNAAINTSALYNSGKTCSTYLVSTANTWVTNPNVYVVVPEDGVYMIAYSARAWYTTSVQSDRNWSARLQNASGNRSFGQVFGGNSTGGGNSDFTSTYNGIETLQQGEKLYLAYNTTAAGLNTGGNTDGCSSITIFRLSGSGTPTPGSNAAGTITDCTTGTLSGTYARGTAMTSANTVSLTVDVTQPGTWSIASDTQNGVSFSGSGTFTATGSQTVTLTATGTPAATGDFNYTYTLNTSTCSRSISFGLPPVPAPNLTTDTTGLFPLPYTAQGGTANGTLNGTPVTATFSDYTGIATAFTQTICSLTNIETYNFWIGGTNDISSMKIRFDKPVANLKVFQTNTGTSETFTYILKRNGTVVSPVIQFSGGTCNQYFTISGNSIIYNSTTHSQSGVVYNLGGVWFDEMVISTPGHSNGTVFNFHVGHVLP